MRVLNKRIHGIPKDSVYVGRGFGSKWGNPFIIGKDGDRDEVVRKYESWLLEKIKYDPRFLDRLKNKDLVCWCAPLTPCHAEILMKYANQTE